MNCRTDMKQGCKRALRLSALLLAGLLACVGCGPSKPAAAQEQNSGPAGAEAARVAKAFASADPSLRFPVEEALRVVKAGGYADALPNLRKLADNARANPEQKQSMQDLVQKLEALPVPVPPR